VTFQNPIQNGSNLIFFASGTEESNFMSTFASESGTVRAQKSMYIFFHIFTNYRSIQKIFFHIRFCRVFFADHFGKKTFGISLSNDDVIVKILNTVYAYLSEKNGILSYFTVFSILTITSSLLNGIQKVFLPK
jgi:hypothetical protein